MLKLCNVLQPCLFMVPFGSRTLIPPPSWRIARDMKTAASGPVEPHVRSRLEIRPVPSHGWSSLAPWFNCQKLDRSHAFWRKPPQCLLSWLSNRLLGNPQIMDAANPWTSNIHPAMLYNWSNPTSEVEGNSDARGTSFSKRWCWRSASSCRTAILVSKLWTAKPIGVWQTLRSLGLDIYKLEIWLS